MDGDRVRTVGFEIGALCKTALESLHVGHSRSVEARGKGENGEGGEAYPTRVQKGQRSIDVDRRPIVQDGTDCECGVGRAGVAGFAAASAAAGRERERAVSVLELTPSDEFEQRSAVESLEVVFDEGEDQEGRVRLDQVWWVVRGGGGIAGVGCNRVGSAEATCRGLLAVDPVGDSESLGRLEHGLEGRARRRRGIGEEREGREAEVSERHPARRMRATQTRRSATRWEA